LGILELSLSVSYDNCAYCFMISLQLSGILIKHNEYIFKNLFGIDF